MKFRVLVLELFLCALVGGEMWSQEPSHHLTLVPAPKVGSEPVPTGTPDNGEWHFVVSGESRNCGDLIMPAIAKGSFRDQAPFYWHLGDFRAIYEYDEDILARKSVDFTDSDLLSIQWERI
jgi:hypothetical protein